MDKFALVYEFNKESPLITYKASKELEAKNYSRALELLNYAIEKYPYHPLAYFLYSSALAYNKEFDKAKEFVAKGDDILGVKTTAEFYLNQIEKIKLESEGISLNFDDTVNEVLNESFLEPEEFETVDAFDLISEKDDELEIDDSSKFDDVSIVTETLAEIYASQNNYEEAIDIYKKLVNMKPDLKEKFEHRITELKLAIENKKQKRFGN